MKFDITSKQKNPLLSREEISFEIKDAKKTPSKKELREKIAALSNAKTELVIIDKIKHEFGSECVNGSAKIYENEKALRRTEHEFRINRNLGIKKSGKTGEKKEEEPKAKEEAKKK